MTEGEQLFWEGLAVAIGGVSAFSPREVARGAWMAHWGAVAVGCERAARALHRARVRQAEKIVRRAIDNATGPQTQVVNINVPREDR